MVTEAEVSNVLKKVEDPELKKNIVELRMVRNIQVGAGTVSFTLEELAEFFGVTRPSLSRVVAELVQQGIIERRGKKVILKDKTRLVK